MMVQHGKLKKRTANHTVTTKKKAYALEIGFFFGHDYYFCNELGRLFVNITSKPYG